MGGSGSVRYREDGPELHELAVGERSIQHAHEPFRRFRLRKRLLGADVGEPRQELGELAPQRLVVLRDAGGSRQQLHGLDAAALARAAQAKRLRR